MPCSLGRMEGGRCCDGNLVGPNTWLIHKGTPFYTHARTHTCTREDREKHALFVWVCREWRSETGMQTYDDGESVRRGRADEGRERKKKRVVLTSGRDRWAACHWIWLSCLAIGQPVLLSRVLQSVTGWKRGFRWNLWQYFEGFISADDWKVYVWLR